jgi:ABC-2 type transport system ATP-binding protein
MAVIEVQGLRKEYKHLRGVSTLAVDGLDLSVPEGGVFGFLGPNGSGKTTTIRCVLGLIAPTAGRTQLLGAATEQLHTVLPRVGSLVEAPSFFPTFSGRKNLLLLAAHYGLRAGAVDAVLDRVGLGARGRDLFKNYSLGMKQRLGIGAALLKEPDVLILDEPANGLDPAGIKEVRELLRSLGDEGKTVFLSSHLLAEVQQICDRVAILSRGRCIAAGPVGEVLSAGRAAEMLVRAADLEAARDALAAAGFAVRMTGDAVMVTVEPADAEKVTRALVRKRVYPTELRPTTVSLEDVFLELTGEEISGEKVDLE